MTPADIDRVFGRGRLRMVTGEHVEVFREQSQPGERRRYTKRFLATSAGDFRHWTEREWRILARLVGHGIGPVPDVVQFDRGAIDRPALVQTYDAGITVDHWATLLPVERDGAQLSHVFEDCAHWWALARHCLIALDAIHELRLVHLDLKADNVCIPFSPGDFDPYAPGARLSPRFEQITLIDFAFSLVSGEALTSALPIARQADYEYQSPRLLQALEAGARGDLIPTRQLDWRCDVYSLAAMLRRYLPDPEAPLTGAWTPPRLAQARALVRHLLEAHDADSPTERPHAELIALTGHALAEPDLADSLERGWALSAQGQLLRDDTATPVTRIAMPVTTGLLRQAPEIDARIYAEPRPINPHGSSAKRAMPWALGAVSAAAMGASVLAAGWWVVRDQQAANRHVMAAAPKVPAARVATRAPAPPPAVVAEAPAPAPAPTPAPAPSNETAREKVHETAAAVAPPATVAIARAAEPQPDVPAAKPTAAPHADTAARSNAARRAPAPAAAPTAAAASRRTPVAAAAPRGQVRPAATMSERQRVLAWLTARGPSPRAGVSFGAPTPAIPAQVAAPAPAAKPAPAPMAQAAAAPIPAPALLPATVQAAVATAQEPASPPPPPDFAARASTLMSTGWLSRAARRAEPMVSQAMAVAAQPDGTDHDDDIREAVSRLGGVMTDDANIGFALDTFEARRLNDAAAQAYWRRGNVADALDLQLKAFGANPLDATVAGQLAFLQLRQRPAQADSARQLALHALTLRDAKLHAARPEDWTTLAIANALLGRDRDARNAWFVALALAPNPETQCRAAISAYNKYGEPLRSPVEAVLYRAYLSGRANRSPFCAWPPYWAGVAGGTWR